MLRQQTYLVLLGSSSNSIYTVHPLIPHGSFSDITIISEATRSSKSNGNSTSVHAKCLLLAVRNSPCKRIVSACNVASSSTLLITVAALLIVDEDECDSVVGSSW